MKIAFVGRYEHGEILSGPGKVAARLFEEACKKHDAEFITYFFDGRVHGMQEKFFGRKEHSDGSGRVVVMGIVPMMRHLQRTSPDIIHIVNFERFASALKYVKPLVSSTFVYTVHGIAATENGRFRNVTEDYAKRDRIAESSLFTFCDKIAFLSAQTLDTARATYNFDGSKCRIVPNGIDDEFNSRVLRKAHGNKLKLVFTGDPRRTEKGFEVLTTALELLDLPYTLHVVTDCNADYGRNIVVQRRMSGKGLAEFYSDKDIFISSSIYEPFCMSATEAMASGLACIASDSTGMSRYIRDGINGFIFPSGDPSALAQLIAKLNSDRELLASAANEGMKIYGILSWDKVFEIYESLYR
ncbi:MAG: glycosyltransferase family 4 protein [Ignavibacteria bacterium]|nr:glycosyltransferase family 4 protein [Ignavibacteria bacterium]